VLAASKEEGKGKKRREGGKKEKGHPVSLAIPAEFYSLFVVPILARKLKR